MTRKLDKEHLEEIQSIREQFAQNANILGNIAIETHFLEKQLEQIKQEHSKYIQDFERLQQQESELVEKMRARYGEGQINIADGTFTPDSGLVQ
jgi:tRNA uridine 5-carbamoylmethylation protein Kti12